MNPRISICLPTYNGEVWIAETIQSVLDQTFTNWELIISDDASTDGTREIVRQFLTADPRIVYNQQQIRCGAGQNWNTLLSLASSKFVKLLGQDDILYPKCLEMTLPAIEQDPKINLVVGCRDVINANSEVVMRKRGLGGMIGVIHGPDAIRKTILTGSNILGEPSFAIFRRSILLDCGGFDLRWNYLIDIAAYASVLKDANLYAVDSSLGAFRVSLTSWSSTLAKTQSIEFRALSHYLFQKEMYKLSRIDIVRSNVNSYIKTMLRRIVTIYINRDKLKNV